MLFHSLRSPQAASSMDHSALYRRCWRRRQRALTVATARRHWLVFPDCGRLNTWGAVGPLLVWINVWQSDSLIMKVQLSTCYKTTWTLFSQCHILIHHSYNCIILTANRQVEAAREASEPCLRWLSLRLVCAQSHCASLPDWGSLPCRGSAVECFGDCSSTHFNGCSGQVPLLSTWVVTIRYYSLLQTKLHVWFEGGYLQNFTFEDQVTSLSKEQKCVKQVLAEKLSQAKDECWAGNVSQCQLAIHAGNSTNTHSSPRHSCDFAFAQFLLIYGPGICNVDANEWDDEVISNTTRHKYCLHTVECSREAVGSLRESFFSESEANMTLPPGEGRRQEEDQEVRGTSWHKSDKEQLLALSVKMEVFGHWWPLLQTPNYGLCGPLLSAILVKAVGMNCSVYSNYATPAICQMVWLHQELTRTFGRGLKAWVQNHVFPAIARSWFAWARQGLARPPNSHSEPRGFVNFLIGLDHPLIRYLHEAGYTVNGQIGCTQPRRVAAVFGGQVNISRHFKALPKMLSIDVKQLSSWANIRPLRSVAKRVADEFGCELGTKAWQKKNIIIQ